MAYDKNNKTYIGYIYCITNSINGKKYIGQTNRDIKTRFSEHIRHCKQGKINKEYNKVLFKAMIKYGIENFYCSEIKTVIDKNKDILNQKLDKEEIDAIKQFNTLVPNGYNMTEGGNHDGCMGVNSKKVAQYSFDGKLIAIYDSETEATLKTGICGISAVIYGKKTFAGDCLWKEVNDVDNVPSVIEPYQGGLRKCRIIQINNDGQIVGEFKSIKEASDFTGINNVTIGDCANKRNNRLTAGGFRWDKISFGTDLSTLYYEKFHYNVKPKDTYFSKRKVNRYDLEDNYIDTFDSLTEAGEFINKDSSGIIECCKGNQKTSGGYKWFYCNDLKQPDKSRIVI